MKISKKQLALTGSIIIIVILGFIFFSGKKDIALPNTTTIKKGDVIQEVSVTGRVKPSIAVDLAFEKAGRVEGVYVQAGEHIPAGKLLAEVESSTAQASLMEAEARLAELNRGSRPEELAVKNAELSKYTQDLENAYAGVTDILNDAFNKADEAVHTKTTGIFSGFKTSSYRYTFSICDSQVASSGEWLRYTSELELDAWRNENTTFPLNPSRTELTSALDKGSKHLEQISSFLESVNRALTLDCTISTTALDTYRTNINTARTNVTAAITAVNTKRQAIATLILTVAKVQDELSLLQAGTAEEVVTAQEARVLSAQGELSKYRIISPIAGLVTKADIKSGESASLGKTVFTVISDASFEIEAYVPEADIAKIKKGDTARITLDAYGSDTLFEGRVSKIDPAETIIDNVPTYKTILHFTNDDARIKSGMTANIDVSTSVRKDVLFAPERAIITRNGEKFIRVVAEDGTTTDTPVKVGLKGSDGTIEILSGATLGTTIIMAPKD